MLYRKLYFDILPQLKHKNAIVICGMRQVGKTTLMRQIYEITGNPKLWFDFDNPLDRILFEAEDYNLIFHELKKLAQAKAKDKLTVFIDEIQNFPEITIIIKYLIDHHQVKFILTGSSNYYLRNLFPESLSGRKFLYILPQLSFTEFLYFNGEVPEKIISDTDNKISFEKISQYSYSKRALAFDEFIEFGSFPEVVLTNDRKTKTLILKNIFSSFFKKDINVFSEFKEVRELRDLILLLAPRNGSILDITKLASELGTNRVKVYNYIEFLQGTFFLKLIPKFSKSIDRSIAGGKKVYFSDTGILNLVAKVTERQLIETAVCNQLAVYGNLSFYNKRSTSEIDFIINNEIAFEVKNKADVSDIERLRKISSSLGIRRYYVLSRKYFDHENVIFPQFI
ncbi:MAG: ATP-binding protein [Bacteroidia bacterium]|nr:ATP-binding protein [Bacteroidia bacterium]